MRVIIISGLIFLIVACGSSASTKVKFLNSGTVSVLNGRGEPDSLRYTCDSCYEILGEKTLLDTIISIATADAKSNLRNALSFIPRHINIQLYRRDSIFYYTTGQRIDTLTIAIADYTCIGKNGYGVEDEVNTSSVIYLVNNQARDIRDHIRKDSLRLEGNVVSRKLTLFDGDKSLMIQPALLSGQVHLIVQTDESCVEDARMIITMEGGEKIELRSWNDFNCKGNSYFRLTPTQLGLLSSKHLQMISYSEDDLIIASVPPNERDYILQFAALIAK